MRRIIKGDMVIVTAGKDKGLKGAVLQVKTSKGKHFNMKVVISGVNVCMKHKKATPGQPGALIKKECFIDASNVGLFCRGINQVSKIAYKHLDDGKKTRIYKKTMECLE